MSNEHLKELIDNYLADAKVMQLATVKDGQPWMCTVNYAVDIDGKYNLYWMSKKDRRHSRELADDSQVAGAIVRNPAVKQGLQFTGIASAVPSSEMEHAHECYGQRYGDKPERLTEAKSGSADVRTYYVIKLTYLVLFDEVNFPDSPRQEYNLKI